jgi:hypothetical protein
MGGTSKHWCQATAALAGLLLLGATQPVAHAEAAVAGGYLTILLAHSAETAVDSHCIPLAGVVTLEQQAATYTARHLSGVTGTVITSWPQQSTDRCIAGMALQPQPKPLLVASWDRLSNLAATYGWSFVSASRTYTDLTQLSPSAQQSEICGSLTDLQNHKLPGAHGLFAYPNNHYTYALQLAVTARCYSFGRTYNGTSSVVPVASPWMVHTYSLNGGNCNDPTLACYQGTARYRYTSPPTLAAQLAPGAGHWAIVQGYRFVTGAFSADTLSWDCTSPNWQQHWTAGPDATEVYCWGDWLAALSHIPAGTTTVSPAQMTPYRTAGATQSATNQGVPR